jgi:hypothetical protein
VGRRLSTAAAVLFGLALIVVPSAAADGLTLDWSVADRLTGPASIDEQAPARPVTLEVGVGGTCPRQPSFALEGKAVTAHKLSGCTFVLPAVDTGKHELTLDGGSGEHASADIDVKDYLVVSIGDSVASGEGNPDGPGVTWLDKRCHRSLRSGAAEAVHAAEQGDRHSVVTFVPLACSGATIDKGLLNSYVGVQPNRKKGRLAPQVDVVDKLQRPVDAALVSVGANDVSFSALARFCMFVDNCPSRHFDPDHPYREAASSFPTAAEAERQALDRLGSGYDRLAARLDGKVDPAKTIIVEYFDPLRDREGHTCPHALPGMSATEAAWAQSNVLAPLDVAVDAAAARHGWQVVSGVSEAFRRHGICAGSQAWVADPPGSVASELGIFGTLHPNGLGHAATATLIAPVLAGTLGIGSGTTTIPASRSGWVRWYWLLVAAVGGAGLGLALRKAVAS